MADKREFLFSFLGKETVSPAAAKAGDAVEDLGDRMADTRSDAKRLDDQIGEVEASLKDLARQYAATGDDKFVGQIRQQERELRKLQKVRVHLGDLVDPGDVADVGVQLGAKIGPVFVQSLGRAVGSAGPAAAIGAPLVLGLASWLGSASVGAILGGAAAGSVAGGIVLAARDSRVRAAGATLADSIGAQLEDAAAPFVPATLRAIDTVRAGFAGLDDEIGDIFGTSASYVAPFTDALVGLAREAAPGLRDLVRGAQPVVTMLAGQLPELGAEIGDALSLLAEHGPEAARALGLVLEVVGAGIEGTARILSVAAEAYKWADILSAGALRPDTAAQYQIAAAAAEESTNSWSGALDGLGDTADTAAVEVRSLSDALDEIIGDNIGLVEATIRAEEAIDEATKAIRENGRNVDLNTEAGRENVSQLTAMAQAFNIETAAADKSGQTSAQAAEMHKRHADSLYAAARAAGYTEEEAKALVAQWLKVPRNVTTTVKSKGVPEVKAEIAGIKGKTITIAMRLTGYTNISGTIAALNKNQRWGGIDYAMAAGGAIEAHYASSPTVLYGERETGGEAFVPRNGDRGRSLQILEKAAGWYGADVVPRGSRAAMAAFPSTGGGGAMPQVWQMPSAGSALERLFLSWLQGALRRNPGVVLRGSP